MNTTVVQLESTDNVASTQKKIRRCGEGRVVLVWPAPRDAILQRRLELLLLLRYSQTLAIQLALVTHNPEVIVQAQTLGVAVFASTAEAQRRPWRRVRVRRRLGRRSGRPAWDELAAQRSALHPLPEPLEAHPLRRLGLLALGLLSILALVFFFLPGARVALAPGEQTQALTLPVYAAPDIRAANFAGALPANVITVTVEGKDETPSSAYATVPDQPAHGTLKFSNLSDRSVEVPAGLVALTLSDPPVRFETLQTATVPAGPGQAVLVEARALTPGTQGNVAAETINALEGALGLSLTVTNPDAMQGGADRRGPAPDDADYQKVRQRLLDSLRQTALQEINSQLAPGQSVLLSSLRQEEILEEQRDPPEGQPADRLRLTLQVSFSAWYVRQEDIQRSAAAALDAGTPTGYVPLADSLVVEQISEPGQVLGGQVRWEIAASRRLRADWSHEAVIQALLGKRPDEAGQALQTLLDLRRPPQIELFPSWWGRLPYLPFRIQVEVEG